MKKSVLVLSTLPADQIDVLRENFEVEVLVPTAADFSKRYAEKLPSAHGLIGYSFPFGPEHLAAAKNLEAVATVSVGYDRFNVTEMKKRGIKLTNTPDVLTETTADLGFTLIMSAARRIPELHDQVKHGRWIKGEDDLYGQDIYGKKLGIVGFGRIGQAVARRGHFGFGMQISYYNRTEKKTEAEAMKAARVNLDTLFAESDFVCVVIPLSAETEHLVGAAQFALMKKHAIFVNIARGKVVDEDALIAALKSNSIRAAGLDVFREEPLPVISELTKLSNVVLTPHVGSATGETRHAMAALAVENLTFALQGKTPPQLVG